MTFRILEFRPAPACRQGTSGRRWAVVLAAALLPLVTLGQIPPEAENPGSLVPATYRSIFGDRIARFEGDLLTIIISESSLASFAAATNTSKKDQNSITELLAPALFKGLIPALGSGASSNTDGKGTTTQSGRLSARMTAVIKQQLPGGRLVIEGIRQVRVNKETQTFFVSGIIRSDDIRSDNTILSEFIADAEIRVDGKGQISDRTRRGIVTRILDWLF